ncbi:ABC transporter permease subunit [Fodinisporobacter ferrooxydans]|uniref:ABC transporter permease subunit n=1 Tax=Fodinisporobacter ferrooxydans TaxID=2901836 RepID=A0ABY4CNY7_9BACL|nr:ABC transporter permease subunit [Alicyclobacillaceae bacterium MYW30-H2]
MKMPLNNGSMQILPSKRLEQLRGGASAASSLLVLFILIVYPLAALLLQIVFPHIFDSTMSFLPSIQPLVQVFADKGNYMAVLNSLGIGITAAILAAMIGTITAFGSVKAAKMTRNMLNVSVWTIFFAPSYVIAEGWMILMQDGGIFAQAFGLPNGWSAWFFTRYGLIFTMALRYFPFVHMAMEPAIRNMGIEFVNAGRLLGASRQQIVWKIVLPLLTPALLAGASIAFAEGFGDFGFAAAIAPQMHIPLISYQIYSALNEAPVNYTAAASLSLLLILVTGGALWLQMLWMNRKTYVTVSTGSKGSSLPAARVPILSWIGLSLTTVALILPIGATFLESLLKSDAGGIGVSNWSFQGYIDVIKNGSDGIQAISRSFTYSLIAAVFTMGIGLFFAYKMVFRKSFATRILNMVTMSTIAVPGVVLAAGFIFAWNAKWLVPIHLVLYSTSACLAMAYIAGSLPYSIRLQVGAMSQLSPNLMKAAQVLGAKSGKILWSIVFPLVSATTVSTFFLAFTGTMFELPASSLLYPAGEPPFSVVIASKFNAFEWEQGAALTMLGLVFVFGSFLLGQYFVSRLEHRKITKQRKQNMEIKSPETEVLLPV